MRENSKRNKTKGTPPGHILEIRSDHERGLALAQEDVGGGVQALAGRSAHGYLRKRYLTSSPADYLKHQFLLLVAYAYLLIICNCYR